MDINKKVKIAVAVVILAACAFGGYHYYPAPEKAQPPATTEKLVHDKLKKTNRLGRKTKKKPADDNRQG